MQHSIVSTSRWDLQLVIDKATHVRHRRITNIRYFQILLPANENDNKKKKEKKKISYM